MTEDRIERIVEKRMDALDRHFREGVLTETEYHNAVETLKRWATNEYKNKQQIRISRDQYQNRIDDGSAELA